MGGRGAGSGASWSREKAIKKLQDKIDRLNGVMYKLARTSGFTYDLQNKEVRKARNKFYATKRKRDKYWDRLIKLNDPKFKKTAGNTKSNTQKSGVKEYEEKTTATYRRAVKRQQKQFESWFFSPLRLRNY